MDLSSLEIQQMQKTDLPQVPTQKESAGSFGVLGDAANMLNYNNLDSVMLESLNQMIARTEEDPSQDDLLSSGNLPDVFAPKTGEEGREEVLILDALSLIQDSQEEMTAIGQEFDQASPAVVVPYFSASKSETYPSQKRRRKMSAREQVLEEKEILEGEDLSNLFTRDPTTASQRIVEIQSF